MITDVLLLPNVEVALSKHEREDNGRQIKMVEWDPQPKKASNYLLESYLNMLSENLHFIQDFQLTCFWLSHFIYFNPLDISIFNF